MEPNNESSQKQFEIQETNKKDKKKKETIDFEALFDTNLIQNIFIKLFKTCKYNLQKKLSNNQHTDSKQYYKTYFSKLNNFQIVCKIFLNISKQTLFNLNICNIKFQIPYNLYLKLSFIEHIVGIHEEKNIDKILIYSCEYGFYDLIPILLKKGKVNINKKYKFRDPPLLAATISNRIKTVKELFKCKELDINIKSDSESTPLMEACFEGFKYIVELFLTRNDIKLNLQDADRGYTALMYAVMQNHQNTVSLLLSRNDLKLNIKNHRGGTALILASSNGYEKIVSLLLKRNDLDPNIQNRHGFTALFRSITNGHENTTSLLLSRNGLDPNIKNTEGLTPLIYAVMYNYENTVSLLLSRNDLDLNIQDNNGSTPLIHATMCNREDTVSLLLSQKNRINLNLKDNYQRTALDHAKSKKYKNIINHIQNYQKKLNYDF